MSTSEQWTSEYGPCPCGKGKILQHWDSPDNPWSRTIVTNELSCGECQKKWVLDGTRLHNREAYEDERRTSHAYYEASKQLDAICASAIDAILSTKALASPKDEYLLLKSAGVCFEGPIRYKRFRLKGRAASKMCRPTSNLAWVVDTLDDDSMKSRIISLRSEMDAYHKAGNAARDRFASIDITSLASKA